MKKKFLIALILSMPLIYTQETFKFYGALVGFLLFIIILFYKNIEELKKIIIEKVKLKHVIYLFFSFLISLYVFYCAIKILCVKENILFKNTVSLYSILYVFFQCLYEEIAYSFVPMKIFMRNFSKSKILTYLLIFSLCFSFFHFIFFAYNPFRHNQVYLNINCLIVLFSFGFIKNVLIYINKNILYSFVLHFSWNIFFFGSEFYNSNKLMLRDPEIFNIIIGSNLLFNINIFLVLIFFVFLKNKLK